jgi:hypothetical protein
MEGWQQDLVKMLETITAEIEAFFDGVVKEVNSATESLVELSDQVTEQIEQAIAPTLDQIDDRFADWLEPFILAITSLEEVISDAAAPVTHTVEPFLNQHPVCVGCRHYHGQSYGENMLVCAMHPHGIEEGVETCPDKELISWSFPHINTSDSDDEW